MPNGSTKGHTKMGPARRRRDSSSPGQVCACLRVRRGPATGRSGAIRGRGSREQAWETGLVPGEMQSFLRGHSASAQTETPIQFHKRWNSVSTNAVLFGFISSSCAIVAGYRRGDSRRQSFIDPNPFRSPGATTQPSHHGNATPPIILVIFILLLLLFLLFYQPQF